MIGTRQHKKYNRILLSILVIFLFCESPIIGATIQDVDTDSNGVVDLADFLRFASFFGRPIEDGSFGYDWDTSGRVDFGDFLIFVSFYGQSYEVPPVPPLTFSLSGLSDSLVVGQIDTLIINIAKNSLRGCDLIGIGIIGMTFEKNEIKDVSPDSITYTYRVALQELGESFVTVQVDICSDSHRDSVRVTGIENQ